MSKNLEKVSIIPESESVPALAQPVTPMSLLQSAVASGNLDLAEKLMSLQDRWEANQARKAFDEAVANAKAEIPVILKNATSHNNKYADFAAIARTVDPVLSRHGLRYRFRSQQTDKTISVTCVLTHKDGHAEENTLTGPVDATIGKNPIQAIGSTLTYLQRYSLVQALGLAASNDDDGKAAGAADAGPYTPPPGSISPEQVDEIRDLLLSVDVKLPAFLAWAKHKRIEDIPAEYFDSCIEKIKQVGASRK